MHTHHLQSAAILRHVARKANLVGETLEEQATVDMLEQEAIDFRVNLTRRCYSDDFETLRGPYLASLDTTIKAWSNYLGMLCESCEVAADKPLIRAFLSFATLQAKTSTCWATRYTRHRSTTKASSLIRFSLSSISQLTYVDFLFYDALQIHTVFQPTVLNGYANLKNFIERIEKLPNIAAYHKGDKYHELPYNGITGKLTEIQTL